MSKEVLKELDQENMNYRIQLGDIRAACTKKLAYAELTGNQELAEFAKDMLRRAEIERSQSWN